MIGRILSSRWMYVVIAVGTAAVVWVAVHGRSDWKPQ
jgi:hypothetical protein